MEEKDVIKFKKEEFSIREHIAKSLGKGKISKVRIEYTPVGEKIIISTHKPGLIIGRGGERINELTADLRKKFKLSNPHIEIEEIINPEFDSKIMADQIALSLERFGPLRFKVVAYRTLEKIIKAGALGVEIRLSGKLPGSRAKTWRFAQGYLKKAGDSAKVVDRAQAIAQTKPGTVGIKVSILSPDVILQDRVDVDEEMVKTIKENEKNLGKPKPEEENLKGKKTKRSKK